MRTTWGWSGSMISHDYSSESTDESPRMMACFDSLVQTKREGRDTSDSTESIEETSDTVVEEKGGLTDSQLHLEG